MRAGAVLTVTPYVGVVGEHLLHLGERDAVAGQMDFVAVVDLNLGDPHEPLHTRMALEAVCHTQGWGGGRTDAV